MPDVAAMIARAAPLWLIVVRRRGGGRASLALLYSLFRWAIGRVAERCDRTARARSRSAPWRRRCCCCSSRQQLGTRLGEVEPVFATPVTQTYARQVRLVAGALERVAHARAEPADDAPTSRSCKDADVFLVFIESYGAIAFERPDMAPPLAAGRADLDAAIHATGRDVVSAYVESPTFGGSSWLAHLSLMSGVEVRDPETNARLMTETARDDRDELQARGSSNGRADARAAAGVAGGRVLRLRRHLRRDAARLPRARVRLVRDPRSVLAREVRRARSRPARRARRCSCSSRPSARTSRSSRRRRTSRTGAGCSWSIPYDGPSIVRAYAQQPDWTHFGPGYVQRDRVRLRDARRLSAAARGSRFRDDPARRSPAGGGGERREGAVGRAGARHRQPSARFSIGCARTDSAAASRPRVRRSAACTRCCRCCRTRSARRALRAKKKPQRSQRRRERFRSLRSLRSPRFLLIVRPPLGRS